ncbi:MAG: hypothetical protein IKW65_08300 [Bacteroidales bacterium]|nr:hypothetical protein [Bacteroidales bacterium]
MWQLIDLKGVTDQAQKVDSGEDSGVLEISGVCGEVVGIPKLLRGVGNLEEVTPEETPEGGDTPAEQAEEGDNIGSYISILVQIIRVVDDQTTVQVYPKGAEVEYAWMATPVDFNWVAGYKYVITLDLGKGGGYEDPDNDVTDDDVEKVLGGQMKFSVRVDSWHSTGYGQNL